MRIFDTHCHLDLLRNSSDVLEDVTNCEAFVVTMTNIPDLYRSEMEKFNNDHVRVALGMHPELIAQYRHQIPLMWQLLPQARYVGEVGLDFSDISSKDEQTQFFSQLVSKCRNDNHKILSIHSRKAVDEVLDIIGVDYQFVSILHWFSGGKKQLHRAIDNGHYFSINASMLNSKKFIDNLRDIPLERILIETDAPFNSIDGTYVDYLNAITNKLAKCLNVNEDVFFNNFRRILLQTHRKYNTTGKETSE